MSAEESQRTGTNRDGTEGLDRREQRDRRVGSVDRRLASTVKKMARDLQDLASAAEDEAVRQLLAATVHVDGEATQSGILTALLEEGLRFASRTAFFLTRQGEVRGWAGRGISGVEGARLDYQEDGVWSRIAKQTGAVSLSAEEAADLCRGLGAPAGGSGVLIPFSLRGQLGGVLYADRTEDEGALGIASLQLLTHSASQAVETAAMRGGGSSPALRFSSETDAKPISVWQPPEEQEPASEPATAEASPVAGATAAAVAGAVAVAGAAAVVEAATSAETVEEEPPAMAEEPEEAASIDREEEPAADLEEAVELEEVAVADGPTEAVSEVTAEEGAEADDAEAVDFEMVSTTEVEEDLQAVEDIEAELEPEPELEDTSDLWAVEEEEPEEAELEEEEEEATFVGAAPDVEDAEHTPEATVEEPVIDRPSLVPPEVGQETVRLDIAALQGQIPPAAVPVPPAAEEETTKLPQWEVEPAPEPGVQEYELEPEEPAAAAAYEIEPEEPVTAPMATPDFSEDATIISAPREVSPLEPSPMSGGYVPPAPETPPTEVTPPADMAPAEVTPSADMAPPTEVAPPPSSGFAAPPAQKAEASGTSQVVPPTDIQGPGSAFGAASAAGAIPEGEEALHEEARRLARLLVSEIKLYNEEIIEEGRRSGNIYDRLKDDIDRSRQMYEERIDPRLIEGDHDYFRLELVQRLAGGDERLLGY